MCYKKKKQKKLIYYASLSYTCIFISQSIIQSTCNNDYEENIYILFKPSRNYHELSSELLFLS